MENIKKKKKKTTHNPNPRDEPGDLSECPEITSDLSFSLPGLCYPVLAPEPCGCWRHPSLAPVPSALLETPLCSEQPQGQTLLSSGPLGTQPQCGPSRAPGICLVSPRLWGVGGQSLGLLLVMARAFWVTRYIMGKAPILSGHDPNVLTSLSSDAHTPPTFLQCPAPHRQVPRD